MPTSGIIIFIFTIISIILPLMFQHKIRNVINKYYIILTIMSLFVLIYFLAGRYFLDVAELSNSHDVNNDRKDQLLSKVLLLDMCPLMAFLLPVTSLFKKTRRIALVLCPITLIGSSITIFGQLIWTDVEMNEFAKFFFIGIWPNRLYFMMHYLTLILAAFVLIINYRYDWYSCIYTLLFYIMWLFYENILVNTIDIKWNASGLVVNDWVSEYGQYHKMYLIWKLPFPQIVIFWYTVIVIVNALIMFLKNIFTKKLDQKQIKEIYNKDNVNYVLIFKSMMNKISLYKNNRQRS